jgi:hypothetical protein
MEKIILVGNKDVSPKCSLCGETIEETALLIVDDKGFSHTFHNRYECFRGAIVGRQTDIIATFMKEESRS